MKLAEPVRCISLSPPRSSAWSSPLGPSPAARLTSGALPGGMATRALPSPAPPSAGVSTGPACSGCASGSA
eukprot:CAMPEP_0206004738 /NCGR_PEP_ID=MMETSP1464-20131121/4163_1 /ASSEMBLY_ACC=CAM_ASM_001124 /TAXON_ID=119497 /ORGANISM="Exanthemachrysis gayraliae, Strain RCC1523" /LENGTH=70 /DNA_ID=CAMNT_0053378155 /DNA_START=134 /DNA_END=343 /DNA_ORIENTATION=-